MKRMSRAAFSKLVAETILKIAKSDKIGGIHIVGGSTKCLPLLPIFCLKA